jgi:hypothetical protein
MSRPGPHLTPGKDPVPIVQEVGWASGPVWTGAENLAPTGIRSPDRPARRQSLYRLRYSAHTKILYLLAKKCLLDDHTKMGKRGGSWNINNSVRSH